jgi:hypothetical protein
VAHPSNKIVHVYCFERASALWAPLRYASHSQVQELHRHELIKEAALQSEAGVKPSMPGFSTLDVPKRVLDVHVSEQHAVVFAFPQAAVLAREVELMMRRQF